MQVTHHASPLLPSATGVKALDNPSGSGSDGGSSADDTSITADDFLTLLVAEMKNQDPTADTDPNAYIDQLVQVNSLQQLIQINQDLGSGSSSSESDSGDASVSSSSPSAHALGAASRLATSLTDAHAQPATASSSSSHPAQTVSSSASAGAAQSATAAQSQMQHS